MRVTSSRTISNNTKKIFSFLLSITFVLLWPNCIYSQETYSMRHYTNENGLPAIGVKGIQLDKANGFLWVGTQGGLVRFDGRNFTEFGTGNGNAVASRITAITQNAQGTIFFEDDNFSLFQIRDNKPLFVSTDSFFMAPSAIRDKVPTNIAIKRIVEKIREQPNAGFLPGWIIFHDDSGQSKSFSFIYEKQLYHYDATNDSLLTFTGFIQFFKLNGQVYFEKPGYEIWKYNQALKKLEPVSITGLPGMASREQEVPGIMWQPGMNEALLVNNENIWSIQRKGDDLEVEPLCTGCYPTGAYITSMQLWPEEGMIFMSSEVSGLYAVRAPFIKTIRGNPNAEAAKVEYAQAEIEPGTVITACGTSFSTGGQLLPPPSQFPRNNIFLNQNGDYWYSLDDTIFHFDTRQKRRAKIKLNDQSIRSVFAQTNNKTYYISNYSIGEITNDQLRILYQLPHEVLKNDLNPTDAIEWSPGIIAIATEKLVLFDTRTATLDTIEIPGLTTKVRSILKQQDYYLIGTYGQGFYMLKNGKVKRMPLDKQQYLSFTHCFLIDENGFCWISTNHGLFKVSLRSLESAYENNLPEIYYHYFGKEDGVFNTELNGGCQPCGLKMSSGLFSFPSMNGIVAFNPSRQHSPPPSNRIFIEKVMADTTECSISNGNLNDLSPSFKDLRFSLALPHFSNPENVYFSYKLEPYHDSWQVNDIIKNNILQFGQLPPGDYKLHLRIRNGFEPEQFQTTTIRFHVRKKWFQTGWFYLSCLFAFSLLTWGLIRWRTASIAARKKLLQQKVDEQTKSIAAQSSQLESQLLQLEEDNKIKSRLIAIISHDMLTPLTFMTLVGKKIKTAFSDDNPNYKLTETLVTVTQELESLTLNMLNWIRFHHEKRMMQPKQFELRALVSQSIEIIATLSADKGIVLLNEIPANTRLEQHEQAIAVIVYNLAINAMKNTDVGEIRIAGQKDGMDYLLTVTDTGKGMSPALVTLLNTQESLISEYSIGEAKKFQFGYRIIKDLLRTIEGTINIESTQGKGTSVAIRFPISASRNSYK